MFKSLEEVKEYVEDNTHTVTEWPEVCYVCGCRLADCDGELHYHVCDEHAPDDKFCSEECIVDFLVNKIGIEESDK